MTDSDDNALAFAMAALAPAAVTGIVMTGFMVGVGFGSALAVGLLAFFLALLIAGLHSGLSRSRCMRC